MNHQSGPSILYYISHIKHGYTFYSPLFKYHRSLRTTVWESGHVGPLLVKEIKSELNNETFLRKGAWGVGMTGTKGCHCTWWGCWLKAEGDHWKATQHGGQAMLPTKGRMRTGQASWQKYGMSASLGSRSYSTLWWGWSLNHPWYLLRNANPL